jgi:hypothetical protein
MVEVIGQQQKTTVRQVFQARRFYFVNRPGNGSEQGVRFLAWVRGHNGNQRKQAPDGEIGSEELKVRGNGQTLREAWTAHGWMANVTQKPSLKSLK